MKVVSVNAEHTVSPRQIAFNTDQDLSDELVEAIHYGHLKFSGHAKVLTVIIPDDSDEPFTAASVNSLNRALHKAQEQLDQTKDKRQRMLRSIAENTGLPLV